MEISRYLSESYETYLGNIFHISSDAAKFLLNVLQVSLSFHHFLISFFCVVGEVFWKLEAWCNEEQREQNALNVRHLDWENCQD